MVERLGLPTHPPSTGPRFEGLCLLRHVRQFDQLTDLDEPTRSQLRSICREGLAPHAPATWYRHSADMRVFKILDAYRVAGAEVDLQTKTGRRDSLRCIVWPAARMQDALERLPLQRWGSSCQDASDAGELPATDCARVLCGWKALRRARWGQRALTAVGVPALSVPYFFAVLSTARKMFYFVFPSNMSSEAWFLPNGPHQFPKKATKQTPAPSFEGASMISVSYNVLAALLQEVRGVAGDVAELTSGDMCGEDSEQSADMIARRLSPAVEFLEGLLQNMFGNPCLHHRRSRGGKSGYGCTSMFVIQLVLMSGELKDMSRIRKVP